MGSTGTIAHYTSLLIHCSESPALRRYKGNLTISSGPQCEIEITVHEVAWRTDLRDHPTVPHPFKLSGLPDTPEPLEAQALNKLRKGLDVTALA